jgi:hypothetical protein
MGSQDGHVLLKLKLGDEWRALSIVNDDLSFQDLSLMAQRLFPSKLKDSDEITFKFLDEGVGIVQSKT